MTTPLVEQTLGQLASQIPGATRLFRDYRLDFCCGGDQSLRHAASVRGLDAEQLAERPCLGQLVDVYNKVGGGNVIGVEEVPESETHKYGVVAPGKVDGRMATMTGMVEKPPQGTAPSNWAIAGRYILQPEIFALLAAQEKGAGNEIQLTDSMAKLMKDQPFHAYVYEGVTHDCGDKIGLLRANVALALKRPDLGAAARAAVEAALKV